MLEYVAEKRRGRPVHTWEHDIKMDNKKIV
jgi:hypothetical protein